MICESWSGVMWRMRKGLANYPKELEQSDSQQSDSEEEFGDETDEPRKCLQKRKRKNWCPSEIRFKKMMKCAFVKVLGKVFNLILQKRNPQFVRFWAFSCSWFCSQIKFTISFLEIIFCLFAQFRMWHGSIQQTVECACTHPLKGSWKCLPDQCHLPISHSNKICSYQCNDQGGFERNCNTHFIIRSMFLFRSLFHFYGPRH